MRFTTSLIALGSIASVTAQSCNADNCLRALRAAPKLEGARAFCGTFTTASVAIPSYAAIACTGNIASRVSSACSCIATTTSAPSTTPAPSSTLSLPPYTSACSDSTYPILPLPTGAFDPEGYAVNNPIGPVSGGAGGVTTTITADASGASAAFAAAITGTVPRVIIVEGEVARTGRLRVGSNKSIIGGRNGTIGSGGMQITSGTNIIIRNLRFLGVVGGDCITVQNTTRVWIDHNDLSSNPNIIKNGPDLYDGLLDIIRGSNWITVSWNYFHDHYKGSLNGNSDTLRNVDSGTLKISFSHNHWKNLGTRGNAGRFGMQHLWNNYYEDFRYQAIHSRSDNQVLVEGNVFRGDTREALSTYGLVIPEDSPNTSPLGDYEIDGYANLGAANDFGGSGVNITQVGNFTTAPYPYRLDPLENVPSLVVRYAGVNKIQV